MANTLTLTEFEALKEKSLKSVYDAIVIYHQQQVDGCRDCECNHIKEMVLYAKVLQSWEQDKFNGMQVTNFVNANNIQAIFNRINQLI